MPNFHQFSLYFDTFKHLPLTSKLLYILYTFRTFFKYWYLRLRLRKGLYWVYFHPDCYWKKLYARINTKPLERDDNEIVTGILISSESINFYIDNQLTPNFISITTTPGANYYDCKYYRNINYSIYISNIIAPERYSDMAPPSSILLSQVVRVFRATELEEELWL